MNDRVAYDVADDRRRERVVKVLAGDGARVQYSLFTVDLLAADLQLLQAQLEDSIDPEEDRIHIVPTCKDCRRSSRAMGRGIPLADTYFRREQTWVL